MAEPKPAPKKGDKCPIDGGELVEMRAPTDDERAGMANPDTPLILGPDVDNAPKLQRAQLGALYQCRSCGYRTRIKDESDEGAGQATGARRSEGADRKPPASDPGGPDAARRSAEGAHGATGSAEDKDAEIARLKAELAAKG